MMIFSFSFLKRTICSLRIYLSLHTLDSFADHTWRQNGTVLPPKRCGVAAVLWWPSIVYLETQLEIILLKKKAVGAVRRAVGSPSFLKSQYLLLSFFSYFI
jgi:hypothetical protein